MIRIEIPIRTPTLNTLIRLHWAARRKLGQVIAWHIRAVSTPPERPLKRCSIYVTRESTRCPDHDGFVGGLKPLLDALQPKSNRHPYGLGYIEDDSMDCIAALVTKHQQGRGHKTIIEIYPAGEQ